MSFHGYPETSEMSVQQLLKEYHQATTNRDSYWLECLEGELHERDIEPAEAS